MSSTFNIAIIGFGVVGQGVAEILKQHAETSDTLKLQQIAVRDLKKYEGSDWGTWTEMMTDSWQEVMENPEIDVVVESMGGTTVAKEVIEAALKAGKHVVTANKDLMALHGKGLVALADTQQKQLLFEASIAGAIPVVHLLQTYFSQQDVQQVSGILNGTSNYILSQMETHGTSFQEALLDAQKLGYAEQDPTNDIKGYDARYKLSLLGYLICNEWLDVESIHVEGIDQLEVADFDYAAWMNKRIRLVGHLSKEGDQLKAFVIPMMLSESTTLSQVTGSTNMVSLQSAYAEETSVIGKGAGSLPTASAIVANLYHIAHQQPPLFAKHQKPWNLVPFEECTFQHTLRFEIHDQLGVVGKVGQLLAEAGIGIYALGQLPQYHQTPERKTAIFTLTLEACQEKLLQAALKKINEADYLAKPVYVLREWV